jgi:hypothetical protein
MPVKEPIRRIEVRVTNRNMSGGPVMVGSD